MKITDYYTRTSWGHIPHRHVTVNGWEFLAPVKVNVRVAGLPIPITNGVNLVYALPGGEELVLPIPEELRYVRIPSEIKEARSAQNS